MVAVEVQCYTACELLPASMHTLLVVKMSFLPREVSYQSGHCAADLYPAGLPSFCSSAVPQAQVLAVAVTSAQVLLLSLELGYIYLKLRKPTGFSVQ